MINWDENISEPPPTKNISIEDLKKIGNGEKDLTDFIPKVMCHSIGKRNAFKKLVSQLIFLFFSYSKRKSCSKHTQTSPSQKNLQRKESWNITSKSIHKKSAL